MKVLMGIDMGGTMVKAAVFDLAGNELASAGELLITIQPKADWMERDLQDAKQKIYRCIRSVLEKTGIDGADVLGIGVTGQGNGAYFFDSQGEPVCNGIMSSDMRSKEYIRTWYKDGTFKKIYPYTRQQLWAGNVCAIIAWFRDHAKELLDCTAHIVTAKDYVRYLLTGEFHTEITEGSGTSCMALEKREYSRDVFRCLGIEEHLHKIPAAIGSSDIGGFVTKEAATLTGLTAGTPVVGGQFDVSASVVSAGVKQEGQMGIVVGSWSINSILGRQPVQDEEVFMQHVYAIDDYYNILEGSATSASNQEWFIDALMDRNEDIYAQCAKMVESTDYRDTLLFLPYIYGTNVHLDAKAMFVGLNGTHRRAHMLRAVYEGVAFGHKMHVERLLRHTKMPDSVRIAGGAARSAVWMQIFADILNADIEVSRATELGTMGVAMNAGVAVGVFSSLEEAIDQWASIKKVYHPDPERAAYYKKKYAAFRAVIEAMDCVWEDIEALKIAD
ncbi:MAG: carbohydrate kinase [Clostridia bacterium]|nr:carbohydrate kinase [Clostridia bacterium]